MCFSDSISSLSRLKLTTGCSKIMILNKYIYTRSIALPILPCMHHLINKTTFTRSCCLPVTPENLISFPQVFRIFKYWSCCCFTSNAEMRLSISAKIPWTLTSTVWHFYVLFQVWKTPLDSSSNLMSCHFLVTKIFNNYSTIKIEKTSTIFNIFPWKIWRHKRAFWWQAKISKPKLTKQSTSRQKYKNKIN